MVHLSSIVNEVIETISSLFIFFKEKILSEKETQNKQKATNKIKIREQKPTKAIIFCAQKLYKSGKIVCFASDTFFPTQNFFLKK